METGIFAHQNNLYLMGEDRTLIESGIQGSTPQTKLQHIFSNLEGHAENYELGKTSYSVSLRRTWETTGRVLKETV
jgi:hypothetical protein